MTPYEERSRRSVPLRALALSVAALAVPVAGALTRPDALGDYGALLWLLALLPAFLLAYYRGWRGVATALAAGMATLSSTQAVALWLGIAIPDILLGVVVAYLAIALGIGWVAELLHRERAQVEGLAYTDPLTRLPNRRHAEVFLENEFAAAERGRRLSIVLFDIDNFKRFNDRFGHLAGDRTLEAFGEVLAHTTRRMNLSARFGGEEFLSVLAGSDADGAAVFADRVMSALGEQSTAGGGVTVSAGIAEHHPGMETPDQLLAAADHALYQAKREGRACVRIFDASSVEDGPAGRESGAGDAQAEAESATPYPREDREIGRSLPPEQLLPRERMRGFGRGRHVLLVEHEPELRSVVREYLAEEGFQVVEAEGMEQAMGELKEELELVVMDTGALGRAGNELVAAIKSRWPATQVVVATATEDGRMAADALNAGADRYIFKPYDLQELRHHLQDAIARREAMLEEDAQRRSLSEKADERGRQAQASILRGAEALVVAVEVRDPYTRGHSRRVAAYAAALARQVDPDGTHVSPSSLLLACRLHDVGKIGIPDAVLNKRGALLESELRQVQTHPRTGRRILESLLDDETVLSIARWHHERWDGKGYPDGLEGEAIPLAARIVSIADALDAMTSTRAYRRARPWGDAVARIRARAGTQFDPALMPAFDSALPELRRIFEEAADHQSDFTPAATDGR